MRTGSRPVAGAAFAVFLLLRTVPLGADPGDTSARAVSNPPYKVAFRLAVHAAIERGVVPLRSWRVREDPLPTPQFEEGATALWVLRRVGEAQDEPHPEGYFRILLTVKPRTVRQASLLVLALCELPIAGGTLCAAAADYAPREAGSALPARDHTLVGDAVELLLGAQATDHGLSDEVMDRLEPEQIEEISYRGGWGPELHPRDGLPIPTVDDTCWALLALEAASRRGIHVPAPRFLCGLEALLRWQQAKGGGKTLRLDRVEGNRRLE